MPILPRQVIAAVKRFRLCGGIVMSISFHGAVMMVIMEKQRREYVLVVFVLICVIVERGAAKDESQYKMKRRKYLVLPRRVMTVSTDGFSLLSSQNCGLQLLSTHIT